MVRPRVLVPIVVAVVVAAAALGIACVCGRAPPAELLQVLDVAPRELEVGDRMVIAGSGFPGGQVARVTFRGVLYRPGEAVQRGAAIEAEGIVESPQRIEVAVGEATQSLFCRAGDRALHTTFEGDVEVAIGPAAPGAAAVAGALGGVTLDFRPSARAFDADREAEGERLLSFLGIHTAQRARGAGLLVRDVAAGSRAQDAGLAVDDVVVRFDGVRVGTTADVLAAPGDRVARIGVRRSGSDRELEREIGLQGFRRAPSTELLGGWLAVLAALVVVLCSGGPAPAPLARALARAVDRLGVRSGSAAPGRSLLRAIGRAAVAALPAGGAAGIADSAVFASLAVMPFGQYLVAEKMDVGILLVASALALAAVAAIGAGSPWRGLWAALHVLWQHVPGAVAVASAVLTAGSLSVREVERSQGGWPWDWLAFRSPAALLASLLLLECARIEAGWRRSVRKGSGERTAAGRGAAPAAGPAAKPAALCLEGPGGGWPAAIVRSHRLIVAGLATALFLGGWSLPGSTPAQQDSRPALEVAGAVVYLAKVVAVALAMGARRWSAAAATPRDRSRTTALVLVPAAMGCALAASGWNGWGPPAAVQLLISASLVVAVFAAVAALGHRLSRGLAPPRGRAHLSPFI